MASKPPMIDVPRSETLVGIVPGSVWAQKPFRYAAEPFVPMSERLESRLIKAEVQSDSFEHFREDPYSPMVYCISGTPDDARARYFAAYLTHLHMKGRKGTRPKWIPAYAGGRQVEAEADPTLLVIYNVAANSTAYKLDRVRDLLVQNSHIPCLLIVAGEDPISFMSTRLYHPVQAVQFFPVLEFKKTIVTV